MKRNKHALPNGHEFSHYRVEKTIGGGGFSIVYLATDKDNGERVAIKEYLPLNCAQRDKDLQVQPLSEEESNNYRAGIKRFFDEASAVASINHPNIIRVTNLFRANNTVYMVMRYEQGKDLRAYIKRKSGKLGENAIRAIFPPLLLGLKELHNSRLLHLDIKPANIFLRPGGNPLLLDFGAARASVMASKQAGPYTLTPGYAPIEQHLGGHVGPWSDLYAIGGSMWSCISGHAPPAATERKIRDTYKPATRAYARLYSHQLLEAIDWCLQYHQLDRPQTVQDLLDFLNPLRMADAPVEEPGLLTRLGLRLPWQS
jgi:hypothetical protein